MKLPAWAKLRGLIFSSVDPDDRGADRSSFERFAIPYSFKPRLSVWEAAVAALIAFLRIFLGCLLFAFWGAYTLLAWSTIGNPFWRVVAMAPLLALFPLLLGILMLLLSLLAKFLDRVVTR